MATNGSFSQQEQYTATAAPADAGAGKPAVADLSKDEVGWYFVEQYYTTLSKSPEKLHLFYGQRSQFVSGLEAEVAPVSVGRIAIQERIKNLDFQDCKVRVSNVDSQASHDNIVIQVIGETSNNSAELKKFVQTFVLAQQPTGYFVLNDIFRYISEEGEEELENAHEETVGPLVEDVEMPKTQVAVDEPISTELDTTVIDKKLEETIENVSPVVDEPTTNGASAAVEAEDTQESVTESDDAPLPEIAATEVEEEVAEAEKPKDPASTPATTRAPSASKPAPPAQASGPPKPLSWARRVAVGTTPKPAVPIITPKTSTPPAQPRTAATSQPAKHAPAPAPTSAAIISPASEKDKENALPGAGWQSVGGENAKRQNRPQSISSPPEKEGTMGYVRNVIDKVQTEELRAALGAHGKLIYFDVNRQKNCAFVEFETPEGYQAAAAANPHQVSGEPIYVEPRRPKATAYGGNGYSGGRGGSLNQRGGRGQFQNRGRGGGGGSGGAPRGRGSSQPTPA